MTDPVLRLAATYLRPDSAPLPQPIARDDRDPLEALADTYRPAPPEEPPRLRRRPIPATACALAFRT